MSTEPQPLHVAYRVSGIARPVDPKYPTNKAILIVMVASAVLAIVLSLVDGAGVVDAGLAGGHVLVLVFLCWALTRELSPDDNPAAFIAVGLALAVWSRVGDQSLLVLAATLMAARVVNRSTGLGCKPADSLILTLGFGLLTWFVSWTLGVVGVVALMLDAVLPCAQNQRRRRHLAAAGLIAIVIAVRIAVGIESLQWPAHLPVFGTIAGLGLVAVIGYPAPRSVGDVDAQTLVHARVRAGLAMGVLTAVLVSIDSGLRLQEVASVWACVLACVLGLPWVWLRRRTATRSTAGSAG